MILGHLLRKSTFLSPTPEILIQGDYSWRPEKWHFASVSPEDYEIGAPRTTVWGPGDHTAVLSPSFSGAQNAGM